MIRYITKALLENDSIYVNDLGTFTKHYVSAKIEGETMLPPHYEVTLDPNIDHEEIIFTNLVCREKQCLITQANAEILQWVDELKNALANNKNVTFEGFGTFSLVKDKILFESGNIEDLNWEFEGMETLSLKPNAGLAPEEEEVVEEPQPEPVAEPEPIIEPEPVAEPEPVVEPEPVAEPEPIVEPVEEPEPVIQYSHVADEELKLEPVAEPEPVVEPEPVIEPEEEEKEALVTEPEEEETREEPMPTEEVPAKRKHRVWPWILLLLLLLAAGALIFLLRGQLKDLMQQLKDRRTRAIEQVDEPEDAPDEAATLPIDSIVEPPADTVPVPFTPEILKYTANNQYPYIPFDGEHFYVIAGSFPAEKDALAHIRQTHLDGFNPYLVLQDGVKNIRICIGIYDTEERAQQVIDSLQKKYWILKAE